MWMSQGTFPEGEDTLVNNTNTYNIEGDNMFSPGPQLLPTLFRNCIFYARNYFVVFFETNYSNYEHL